MWNLMWEINMVEFSLGKGGPGLCIMVPEIWTTGLKKCVNMV